MKISCPSCPAKYTIADEKVAGKIVKIRCKKCGATIVVNGAEAGAEGGAGGAAEGVDTSWMVNVADGDQRTMTPQEVASEFRVGTVHEDTYCWRDGMEDWAALRDIPELMALVAAPPSPGLGGRASQSVAPHSLGGYSAPAQAQPDLNYGGAGLFGAPAQSNAFADNDEATQAHTPASLGLDQGANNYGGASAFGAAHNSPAPAPVRAQSTPAPAFNAAPAAARRAGGRGAAGDLFGAPAQMGGESGYNNQAPVDDKLTGQRNENSVLFSLGALTSAGNAKPDNRTTVEGDGSGLIDIRALSRTMAQPSSSAASRVDDIMNLGGGGAFNAALTAPALLAPVTGFEGGTSMAPPAQSGGNKGLLVALIGLGVLLLAGIGVVVALLVLKKPADPVAAMPPVTTPNATNPTAAVAAVETAAPGPTAVAPSIGSASASTAVAGGPVAMAMPNNKGVPGTDPKPGTASTAVVVPNAGAVAEGPKTTKTLEQQMAESAGKKPEGPAAPPAGDLPPFDRGAASAALAGVNVASCKKPDGPTGSGHVKVTFAPNGSVQSAVADTAPFQGTAVGGCIAGKFRGAHVPAFSGSAVGVGKSFTLN